MVTAGRTRAPGEVLRSIVRENREQLGIMPPSVAPEHAAGDAFVLVAAFLVDPLHRGVHRVARDAMEPELTEGEPGPDSHRVGGIAAPPGRALADQGRRSPSGFAS